MRTRQCCPERLRDGAEPDVLVLDKAADGAFESRLVPGRVVLQGGFQTAKAGPRLAAALAEQPRRLGRHGERPIAHQKRQIVGKLGQRLRTRLRLGQQGRDAPAPFVRGGRRVALGESLLDAGQQFRIGALANVMAVEAQQLLHVEARSAAVHRIEVEPGDGLGGVDDLVVAVTPAEPEQRVAHRGGQNAELGIGADGDRTVPLGELRAVGAMDQRDMGVSRRLPPKSAEELSLAKRVGEVVVTPDRVGDPHVVVVDDHREHVGRRAVGPQQHHVVESTIVDLDISLYQIGYD